jgi:tetratricopeptide (TPR) repeat protein
MRLHLFLASMLFVATPAFATWQDAQKVVAAADADVIKNGIKGIESHVADLEKALAEGATEFPMKTGVEGTVMVLTDGPAENLLVLMTAAGKKQAAATTANPYPEAGLLLALYYNEQKKPDEALRVIATTLERQPIAGANVGAHMAGIFSEQAFAYNMLKRWDDSLAAADAGLKASQNDRDKSRSQRNRGFALVELHRLDDAEAAYKESLRLEPNNPRALGELQFIAKARASVPATKNPASAPSGMLP